MTKDNSVMGELINAARLCRTKRAELLSAHGLYSGQDVLLKTLAEEDGQTMGALAVALGVKPPTITKMVSRMSAQNLLERKASKTDSRQTFVYLSKPGQKLVKKINKIWKKADAIVLDELSEKQTKQLLKALNKISFSMENNTIGGDGN